MASASNSSATSGRPGELGRRGFLQTGRDATRVFAGGSSGLRAIRSLRVSREAALLSILVVLFSSLDAALTLMHVGVGGSELNPLMAAILALGVGVFVTTKTVSTAAGVVFLASQESFLAARLALRSAAVLYVFVLAYHGWLLSA